MGGFRDVVWTEPRVNMEVVVVAVVWILVAQTSGFLVGYLILVLVVWYMVVEVIPELVEVLACCCSYIIYAIGECGPYSQSRDEVFNILS